MFKKMLISCKKCLARTKWAYFEGPSFLGILGGYFVALGIGKWLPGVGMVTLFSFCIISGAVLGMAVGVFISEFFSAFDKEFDKQHKKDKCNY